MSIVFEVVEKGPTRQVAVVLSRRKSNLPVMHGRYTRGQRADVAHVNSVALRVNAVHALVGARALSMVTSLHERGALSWQPHISGASICS